MSQRGVQHVPGGGAPSELHQWWLYARATARALAAGTPPPTGTRIYGPILEPDEEPRVVGAVEHSRLYAAGDGSWSAPGAVVFGSKGLLAASLAGSAIARSRARNAAADAAQIRWRDIHYTTAIATDLRILCDVPGSGWQSFWFDSAREYHPSLDEWTLILGWDECPPLRLRGPAAMGFIPWVSRALLGPRWTADPRLTRLLIP